jgi:glycosyltransferase involved in cell wall biosynthesis
MIYKVVVISDGINFQISNFDLTFVQMKELPFINNFFKAEDLDNLFQNKNKKYIDFLDNFYRKFKDFDIIICDQINPFHPEWLYNKFPRTIKIYGMIDDPACTYHRTLSELWAFNGVFYVSPGYNEMYTMKELLEAYNSNISTFFLPHARYNNLTNDHIDIVNRSFENRSADVLYVGAYYESKIDRLIYLKKKLGKRLNVYGYWPYNGYRGILRVLQFKVPFSQRVNSISEQQKFDLFLQHKICFNMNWNEKRETGNMRMYQAPFYGMLLLCDTSAKNQHEIIFNSNEAVYYDGIEDAIEKIEFYLKNDNERIRIAKNGFQRAVKDYNKDKIWIDFLNWAISIK